MDLPDGQLRINNMLQRLIEDDEIERGIGNPNQMLNVVLRVRELLVSSLSEEEA
jgi:hypothetical protein